MTGASEILPTPQASLAERGSPDCSTESREDLRVPEPTTADLQRPAPAQAAPRPAWEPSPPAGLSPHRRFWSKVEKIAGCDCWIWTGALAKKGYGHLSKGRDINESQAHRYSYRLAYGPIPEGMLVCHKCDIPCCVRPDHLFLGTYTDNILDAVKKRRHGNSRLTQCPAGHSYDSARWYRGSRYCRVCELERTRQLRANESPEARAHRLAVGRAYSERRRRLQAQRP